MDRRKFLVSAAVVSVVGVTVGKAAIAQADLSKLLSDLESMQGKNVSSTGLWTPSEVFQHCAASIQGSMQGYPEHKSAVFQATVGKAALTVFQAVGAMRHSLSEPIPGMPALDTQLPFAQALTQLIASLQAFIEFKGPLKSHFAYGELSYADYALAHQLHIRNHLTEFVFG